jgi:hypothetical protein
MPNTAAPTFDSQSTRNIIGRVKAANCEPGSDRDAYELALLAERMWRQLGLSRDALRRAGFGVEEIGDDVAGLIDRFNADARDAVGVAGTESARLRKRLADAEEMLLGILENGPWLLITDPALRRMVGEYVADTCHSVAAAAGLDEAMVRAHDAMPQRLARSLPAALPDSGAPRRDLAADEGSEDDRPAVADLPSGSIIADDLKGVAYYAAGEPGEAYRWEKADVACDDSIVDYALRHGAEVVRVGDGDGEGR